MITADKTKNKNFKKAADNPKRLAEYLLYGLNNKKENEKQRVLCKGTFNCFTEDLVSAAGMIRLLNERYNATASARSKNRLRTHHLIISLNAGEHLSKEQWCDVAKKHLKALNLNDHLALWAVHKDTDNEHMHLVFSDVNPQTLKINNLSNDRRKYQKLDAELEELYLIKTDNHALTHFGEEALSMDYEAKTAQQSLFSYIKEIKPELDKAENWNDFFICLNENGIKCEKLGRGIVFKVQDPFDIKKNIYIKGSAFSNTKHDSGLSLSALEKRFGLFDNTYNYSEERVKRKYEAKPVNFFNYVNDNTDTEKENEFYDLLENAFSDFYVVNKENQKREAIIEKRIKELDFEYKKILDQERKKYKERKQKIKQSYFLYKEEMQKELDNALSDYIKKRDYLKQRKREIIDKLKYVFSNDFCASNFLDYLKRSVLVGVKKERNLLLLLSRKESQKQSQKNYITGPRVRIIKADSVADTLMYVKDEKVKQYFNFQKVTGKGQIILHGKKRNIGDFIKDDGLKVMCNDNPSTITVKTIATICQNVFEKNKKLVCYGNPDFQRMLLEFSLKKDFNLAFYNNEELNNEYERRRSEHRYNRTKRNELKKFSEFRRKQRDRSIRKATRYDRRKTYGTVRRFRIDESTAAEDTPKQQYFSISTDRNIITNTEYSNDTRRSVQQNDAKSQSSLRNVSQLSMAAKQQRASMLLSDDTRDSLGVSSQREVFPGVRWQIRDERDGGINEVKESKNDTVLDILNKFDSTNKDINSQKDLKAKKGKNKDINETDLVLNYIKERNEKYELGYKDVLHHEKYSEQKGTFVFKGLREFSSGNFYALLEQQNKIYVKKIDGYALSRLKKTKRGNLIKIDSLGRLINNNHKY